MSEPQTAKNIAEHQMIELTNRMRHRAEDAEAKLARYEEVVKAASGRLWAASQEDDETERSALIASAYATLDALDQQEDR